MILEKLFTSISDFSELDAMR